MKRALVTDLRSRLTMERFWEKVNKKGSIHPVLKTRCWEWEAGISSNGGYGCFSRGKKTQKAHRYAYEIYFGRIPDNQIVLHKCDNPRCVRPSHLSCGTHQDNMTDMVNKGRSARGDRHGSKTKPECRTRGEKIGKAKLTEAEVLDIRRLYSEGNINHATLGIIFNVCGRTISLIVNRKIWKHI